MKYLQNELREKIYDCLKDHFELEPADIQFSIPPQRKFGDLSTTIPFILGKRAGEKPFVIGKKIIDITGDQLDMVNRIELAGGGFLNFYLEQTFLFRYMLGNINRQISQKSEKIIVEHTSINPNKAAHIGHLRNSCLGDTLVRILKFLGYPLEIQNYIDDTGIQVADVVWGLLYRENRSPEDIRGIPDLASYLWEFYPEVSSVLVEDETLREQRNDVHKRIEAGQEPEFSVCQYISEEVLKDHIDVMKRLDIRYDLLVRESDIIRGEFFDDTASLLKGKKIMYLSEDPDKEGCWVIKYQREKIEKIVIRSNGTVTYIGKDIAYTFWKLGLLSKDFNYHHFFNYADGGEIYITDSSTETHHEKYGNGSRAYNVIDVRQSYLQNIIQQIVRDLSADEMKEFFHFGYEMVALTPRCVRELGFPISTEEEKKQYVEVSGRRGIAVKASDLIDMLIDKSKIEVQKRNTQLNDHEVTGIATDIAVGALRYFMIKYTANSVIAFDFEEVLSFEGDTGPYLQYTVVRLNSILRKLDDPSLQLKDPFWDSAILDPKEFGVFYELILKISECENQMELAIEKNELSVVTNHTYTICQMVNHYYHLFPIVSEENIDLQGFRINLVLLVKHKLEQLLDVLGIPVPPKM